MARFKSRDLTHRAIDQGLAILHPHKTNRIHSLAKERQLPITDKLAAPWHHRSGASPERQLQLGRDSSRTPTPIPPAPHIFFPLINLPFALTSRRLARFSTRYGHANAPKISHTSRSHLPAAEGFPAQPKPGFHAQPGDPSEDGQSKPRNSGLGMPFMEQDP